MELNFDSAKFTPEQYAILKRMMMPNPFDPSTVARNFTDVSYGPLPEQKLDIYLPPTGDGPWPLIIYVHGGGWTLGSKRECSLDAIIDALNYGYAIISVDYRLVPQVIFPEFLYDVKTAVRWARANAAQYGFDPERFAVMGDSAGGNLALMIGFTADIPEYEGYKYGWSEVSSSVQAVVDMFGTAILNADDPAFLKESGVPEIRLGDPNTSRLESRMKCFTTDAAMLAFISPLALVHKDIPPVLILQGEMDPTVPKQHSILLAERIHKLCGSERADLRLYPERTHADYAFMTDETAHTVVEFLDKHLK